MNYSCPKCGKSVEIVDVEVISSRWKRYYLYCFECDLEFTGLMIMKRKEK